MTAGRRPRTSWPSFGLLLTLLLLFLLKLASSSCLRWPEALVVDGSHQLRPSDETLSSICLRDVSSLSFRSEGLVVEKLGNVFNLTLINVAEVVFEAQALATFDEQGTVVNIDIKDGHEVRVRSHVCSCVVKLRLVNVSNVYVESEAFGGLDTFVFEDSELLQLAPKSLFPAVHVHIEQVRNVVSLPSHFLATNANLTLVSSHVEAVEKTAFSALVYGSIEISDTSITRVESFAFGNKSLIAELNIRNCSLINVAGHAVNGAISKLSLVDSHVALMGAEAMTAHVANLVLRSNVFGTLTKKALSLRSWNKAEIRDNLFQFVESQSFFGFQPRSTKEGQSSLSFVNNSIVSVNVDALLHLIPDDIQLQIDSNTLGRECECRFIWQYGNVCRRSSKTAPKNLSNHDKDDMFCGQLLNSANCTSDSGPLSLVSFNRSHCSFASSFEEKSLWSHAVLWSALEQRLALREDKDILWVLLLTTFALALIVFALSLLYSACTRVEEEQEDEEVKQGLVVHYETFDLETNMVEEQEADESERYESIRQQDEDLAKNEEAETSTLYSDIINTLQQQLENKQLYHTVADKVDEQETYAEPSQDVS